MFFLLGRYDQPVEQNNHNNERRPYDQSGGEQNNNNKERRPHDPYTAEPNNNNNENNNNNDPYDPNSRNYNNDPFGDYDIDPRFNPELEDYKPYIINEGERTALDCQYDDIVNWRRTDGRPPPYKSYIADGTLTINRTPLDAAGKYECFVYDDKSGMEFLITKAELIIIGKF